MRWVWLAAAMVLAATALAGCGSSPGDDGGDGTGTPSGTAGTGTTTPRTGTATGTGTTTTRAGTGTGTTGPGGSPRGVELSATAATGEAPLNVTFGLKSGKDAKSWTLSFGDGSEARKGDAPLPASLSHTYTVGGNFTATLSVTFEDKKTEQDTLAIRVTVPSAGPPPETHFEFGPAAGCENSLAPVPCASFVLGPSQAQAIDGHWLALDSRYWGKSLTSAIDPTIPGDSDCVFVAEDAATVIGEAHNGSLTCEGIVPANTAWLFIYSYVTPENAITVDFVI